MESGNFQFKYFKGTVPEKRVGVTGLSWRCYDSGPKNVPPLICLGGVAANADAFFKQILSLSAKGYRVLSIDFPVVWSHQKWITSFDLLLDKLNIHQIHLYGTSFGGFMAQIYAQRRPRRVLSLIISNTFLSTDIFKAAFSPWCAVFRWTPDFVLKRLILEGLQEGLQEPLIADAIDFIVIRLEKFSQSELASRLVLNTEQNAVGSLSLNDSKITIMDSLDHSAIHSSLRESVYGRYPKARMAFLKNGGDFPFLSRADEVNLHLLLHLRRVEAVRSGPDIDTVPVSVDGRWAGMQMEKTVIYCEEEDLEQERNESDGVADTIAVRYGSQPSKDSNIFLQSQLLPTVSKPSSASGFHKDESSNGPPTASNEISGEMDKIYPASLPSSPGFKRNTTSPFIVRKSDSRNSFYNVETIEHPLARVNPAPVTSRPSFESWSPSVDVVDPLGALAKCKPVNRELVVERPPDTYIEKPLYAIVSSATADDGEGDGIVAKPTVDKGDEQCAIGKKSQSEKNGLRIGYLAQNSFHVSTDLDTQDQFTVEDMDGSEEGQSHLFDSQSAESSPAIDVNDLQTPGAREWLKHIEGDFVLTSTPS